MQPAINIEETPDRVVGRRKPPRDGFSAGMDMQAVIRELRSTFNLPGIPKGVYRFQTHEEADTWLTKMLARPRKES
jgi:hypothetical protein